MRQTSVRPFSSFFRLNVPFALGACLSACCAPQSPLKGAKAGNTESTSSAKTQPKRAGPADAHDTSAAAAHTHPTSVTSKESKSSPTPTEQVAAPPPPAPPRFEGRETVTYAEFVSELRAIADNAAHSPQVKEAHEVLLQEKNLTPEEMPLESFSRVRLAFESGRDSGLWGIRGEITDQMPWSDRVWQQWQTRSFTDSAPVAAESGKTYPTAVGECDELGALFVILARDMGVSGFVGLHWPYWNHVVPVWQISRADGSFVRIVVPSTQSFLTPEATLGTTELPTNRVVFPYTRKDRKNDAPLAADLARFLLHQSEEFATASTYDLTQRRLWQRWEFREQ